MRSALCIVFLAAACGDGGDPDHADAAVLEDGAPQVDALLQARVVNTGSEGASLREGPGLEFAEVRVIPEGEIVTVVRGPQFDWWRVQYDGSLGWVDGTYLEFL